MKALIAIFMLVAVTFVWAGETPVATPPAAGVVSGEVLEVQNVTNFTYLRLKTGDGEVWAAVVNTPVKLGASVTIENAIVMKNFESKALKKTFPTILFGSLGGAGTGAPTPSGMMGGGAMTTGTMSGEPGMSGHPSTGHALGTAYATIPAKKQDGADERIPRAKAENARTVAEIIKKAAALKDKTVVVRGKVVKYNSGIMGKNWIHLRDGSGSAKDDTNDILVTTANDTKLGDVVTVKGVVHNNKDFGAGYAYKVLIEEATLE